MNVQLTEEIIRSRASDQSYEKGRSYFRSGAIYNPTWQSTIGGIVLTAQCEGSIAPSYRLRVGLDAGGVRSASCTCPYDWGGDCKHIVALLLIYLHKPNEFSEQKSVGDLLASDDWNEPAYIDNLEEVLDTAKKFLEAGDAEGALIILRVLLEETLEDYDGEMDYNGDVAGFIQDLGMPMAEAILSLDMDSKTRATLQESIEEILDDLDKPLRQVRS